MVLSKRPMLGGSTTLNKFLIDHVSVVPHYQRSIRIDTDIGREEVLRSYVLTSSSLTTLAELSQIILSGNQAAFTWTGPYGTGKSALAVFLSGLIDGDSKVRKIARKMLPNDPLSDRIDAAFLRSRASWKVIPVTADRSSPFELINNGLKRAGFKKPGPVPKTADGLIQRVEEASKFFKGARPLIILDEMGKCLESAFLEDGDIYDFQLLAEGFARSSVRPVLIGILHQGFEYYASKMSIEIRQEWSKVQGRFVDLTLKTTTDEVVNLTSRAIQRDYESDRAKQSSSAIYKVLKLNRPNIDPKFEDHLERCWPLHAESVLLISALSRKAFTQAQRSLFGFLSSSDSIGFKDFLKHKQFDSEISYRPKDVFDYVFLNFDAALSSSMSDSKRWAIIKDGLARVEAKYSKDHIDVYKTIAVMELLKEPQSLTPTREVLSILFDDVEDIERITKDLASLSVIVFRRYQNCWSLYAGSDFDFEAVLSEEKQRLALSDRDLERTFDTNPVVAKLHYSKTGALRWLTRRVVDVESFNVKKFEPKLDGAIAAFVMVIGPTESALKEYVDEQFQEDIEVDSSSRIVLGVPRDDRQRRRAVEVYKALLDLTALEEILRNHAALDGDEVARNLVREQAESARLHLFSLLDSLTGMVDWQVQWNPSLSLNKELNLFGMASKVADDLYSKSPPLINELLNRDSVSNSAAKARKELMNSMLSNSKLERLGIENWPAEAGLYESLLLRTKHHVKKGEVWVFECSTDRHDSFGQLWEATDSFLKHSVPRTAESLYAFWQLPPFGIKEGIAPLLLWTYMLARAEKVVFYIDDIFQPELAPISIDELLRIPGEFSVRYLTVSDEEKKLLEVLADEFARSRGKLIPTDILSVARAVVREFLILPTWTKRTGRVSQGAREIRTEVLRASDPNRLLFVILPKAIDTNEPRVIVNALLEALSELRESLPLMAQSLWIDLLLALGISEDSPSSFEDLQRRADEILSFASDPGLRTLLLRLSSMTPFDESSIEQKYSLICTAAGKTGRDFFDHDIDVAKKTLREWAFEFRKVELLSRLTTQSKRRVAITLGLGMPGQESSLVTFDVDRTKIERNPIDQQELFKIFERLTKEDQAVALIRLSKTLLTETHHG